MSNPGAMPSCAGTVVVAKERENQREIDFSCAQVLPQKLSRGGKRYLDSGIAMMRRSAKFKMEMKKDSFICREVFA